MLVALTREVSPHLDRCQLTHLAREPIDVARAQAEHRAYERCLKELGCWVEHVRPAPELPDSVFIEDTAVVTDELAVVTRPGAPSRRPETAAVAAILRAYRPIVSIEQPGTVDGGDVLRIGRMVFVGRSSRTNAEGAAQLARHLTPLGYLVQEISVTGCLHLKSAAAEVADNTLLYNPAWVDRAVFRGLELIEVVPSEPMGGNALRVGDTIVYADAWVRTRERLERSGIRVVSLDTSELAKAEAGVTCCSLIFHAERAA